MSSPNAYDYWIDGLPLAGGGSRAFDYWIDGLPIPFTYFQALTYTGTGGVVFGGAATFSHGRSDTGVGGALFGGAATFSTGLHYTDVGVITFGGTAPYHVGRSYTGAGGVILGGTAPVVWNFAPPPTTVEIFHAPWVKFDEYIPKIRMRPKRVRVNPLRKDVHQGKAKLAPRGRATISKHLNFTASGAMKPVYAFSDIEQNIHLINEEREIRDIIACIEEELCHA